VSLEELGGAYYNCVVCVIWLAVRLTVVYLEMPV
jgi:hypothetical protein